MKTNIKYWIILFLTILQTIIVVGQQNPNSLSFDGKNDFVSFANENKLKPQTSITVESMINLRNWNALNTEDIISTFTTYGYLLKFQSGIIQAVVYRKSTAATVSVKVNNLKGWHHVAFTYDGRNLKLYLDGILKSTNDAGGSYSIIYNPKSITTIGSNSTGSGEFFDGNIDEVRIWSVARSISQISGNMNSELSTYSSNLNAYYRFNQGIANSNNSNIKILSDLTSNGINGTLNNFALNNSVSNWSDGYPLKPIDQASNITFNKVLMDGMTISWMRPGLNKGGNYVKVFMKQASTGTASPVDGNDYKANSRFGSGTQIGLTGWYCVYSGNGTTTTVTNLSANKAYSVNVIEYQAITGLDSRYCITEGINNPANKTTDMPAPTVQATNLLFIAIASDKFTATWKRGNGTNCIVFIKQANTGVASPIINTSYSANNIYGKGSQIGASGWYCVYKGSKNSVIINGLNGGTTYRVMVCEFNGSTNSENYLTSAAANNPYNQTTDYSIPTTQSSDIVFSSITNNSFNVSWSRGNGSNCVVFIKRSNSSSAAPTNQTTYIANNEYGSGTEIGTTEWYCVYNDKGNSVNISGLTPGTIYRIMTCEYNGTAGFEKYLTNTSLNNPNNQITSANTPTVQASEIVFSAVSNSSITASWIRGNGSSCIAFMKQTNNTNPFTLDNTTYAANSNFKSGSQIGSSGWYCVYNGNQNSVTITGLEIASTYKMMVFEYNSLAGSEKYNTNAALSNPNICITKPITTWNGSSWDNGAPSPGTAVIISGAYNQTSDIICKSLFINESVVMNVMPGKALTVNSDFTNFGTFTLKSPLNNTASGSFIAYGQTANFGSMNAERYIAPSTLQADDKTWHSLSAPISNYLEENTYSGDYVYKYDEPSNEWFKLRKGDSIYHMNGYLVKTFNPSGQVINFNGTLSTGIQTKSISNSMSDTSHGYNLIGNPYPSAIDWNATTGWTKNNISGTIWIWNPVTQVYATWDGTVGTNGGSRYIPAMQSFFVQVNAGYSSGSIIMTDAIRLHNSQTSLKSARIDPELISLRTSGNNFNDEFILYKSDNPNTAYKLFSEAVPVPQIYNVSGNEYYSILKLSTDANDTTIQIGFKCSKDGEYSITADKITFDSTKSSLFLTDNLTGMSIKLGKGTSFKFIYHSGENELRFSLQIKKNQSNATLVANSQIESIKIWSSSNHIYFNIPFEGLSTVVVYDVAGRNLLTKTYSNKGQFNLELSKSGIYFVNVMHNRNNNISKVFLK